MIDRRTILQMSAALGVLATGAQAESRKRIPVIFHTDIGGDVDDTWALLLLLRRPELDLKLVVTEGSNAIYRGRLAAKLLTLGGSQVPIAIGTDNRDDPGFQSDWVGDFKLTNYRGEVRTDGARAMVETIMASPEPVTLITVGPATTAAEALKLELGIAQKAKFVAMAGSVFVGYGAGKPPEAEYNVKTDPASWQAVFAADWLDCAITPLDTCGVVVFEGEDYQRIRNSNEPFAKAVIANSEVWAPHAFWMPADFDVRKESSTQFDAVAVVMACDESDLVMETLPIRVTAEGMTTVDAQYGRPVRVATKWKDMAHFKYRMVLALAGPQKSCCAAPRP